MMANQETPGEQQREFRGREPAWRCFAAEFNDADHEIQEEGEYAPNYVITPLGARVNRVVIVGVLTANDPMGDEGGVRRAQVTDPTGVFHIYAGQYQPEALQALQELDPPAIVAVVGKARTYSPEEGVVYTSIRPETIRPVTSDERDAWILEAAEHTLERVQAVDEALQMDEPTEELLTDLDIEPRLAKGVLDAVARYSPIDLQGYLSLVSDALGYLMPAAPEPKMVDSQPTKAPEPEPEATTPQDDQASQASPEGGQTSEVPEPNRVEVDTDKTPDEGGVVDPEGVVFDLVEEIDEGDGAGWDAIVARAAEQGLTEEDVEEAMNLLMDRGRVFEPVLGRLKAT